KGDLPAFRSDPLHVCENRAHFHADRQPAFRDAGPADPAACRDEGGRNVRRKAVRSRLLHEHGVLQNDGAEKDPPDASPRAAIPPRPTRGDRAACKDAPFQPATTAAAIRYSRRSEQRAHPLSAGGELHPVDLSDRLSQAQCPLSTRSPAKSDAQIHELTPTFPL